MPTATVTFKKLIQNSQNYQSFDKNDDHVISVIHFDLAVGGNVFANQEVEVKQPWATDYLTEPLEVGRPRGSYDGPWNHAAFSDLCEDYYRWMIGAKKSIISLGQAMGAQMRNNVFELTKKVQLEIPAN